MVGFGGGALPRWPRWWVRVSSIFSAGGVLLVGGLFFVSWARVAGNNQIAGWENIFILQNSDFRSGAKLFILIFIIWQLVQTLVFSFGLFRYSLLSDADFIANKWALVFFSLSLGGFFTPLILLLMPNADTKATRVADSMIVRYLGSVWWIAPLFITFTLLSTKTWLNSHQNVGVNAGENLIFYSLLGAFLGVGVLGLLTTCPFYNKQVDVKLFSQQSSHRMLWAIVIFYRLIASAQMVLLILVAIFRIVAIVMELFRGRNVLALFLNAFRLLFAIASAAFIVFMVTQVLSQLWKHKTDGLVTLKQSEKFAIYQKRKQQHSLYK